jgi:type I restriction enzyme S subunit
MSKIYPLVPLYEVLTEYKEYIETPEPKIYPKLSVKLYGKGVVLDEPADGTFLRMKKHQIAKSGQVILSEIWGKKGAIGFVPPEGHGALCTSHFFLFDVNYKKLEPKYLQLIFSANFLEEQLNIEAKGTTGYAAVRPKYLLTAKIPLPPLEEQRRIVARVEELAGKFEEVRSLRQKALEESEALTKAAMRQIFKPHENYQEVSLESVCATIIDNLHSNPVYSDNGVPCIRSSDVGWGALYLHTARCTSEEEYKRRTVRGEPIPNDIVLVREGGGTGKAAIVLEGQRFSLGQRVMMLRPDKNKVIPKFFLYQILSPSVYEDQIIPRCKGSASPHLNIGALRKFNFFLPPLPKQHRIVNYLDELQTKLDTMKYLRQQAMTELDALLPSILDKAFKGEL